MAFLNKVLLIGNLTRDPELRFTPSGSAVAEFGMAMNRIWKGQDGSKQEEATFVEVTAWGKTAELAKQYLHKGRRVFIEGRLKFDQWTSPEGQKRSKLSVVAENLQFMDAKGEGQGGGQGGESYGGRGGGSGYAGPSSQAQQDFGPPDQGYGGYGDTSSRSPDDPPF